MELNDLTDEQLNAELTRRRQLAAESIEDKQRRASALIAEKLAAASALYAECKTLADDNDVSFESPWEKDDDGGPLQYPDNGWHSSNCYER